MSGNKRYKNRIANIQRKGEDKEYFEDEEDKDKISESQGMLTREKTSAQGNHQSSKKSWKQLCNVRNPRKRSSLVL